MSWIHAIPSLLLAAAFPIVVIVTLLEYGIAATVGLIALILFVGALYQHYFVPLVVRSKPENE